MAKRTAKSFEIRWEAEDGYCGGSRPQHFEMDLEDFDYDMDLNAIQKQIEDCIQEDFMQKITWSSDNYQEVAVEIKAALDAKRKTEEEADADKD